MNKVKNIILLLLAVLIFSSCNKKLSAIFSPSTKLEVFEPQFEYLSAKAKVKLDLGGKGIGTNAHFRMKKDSVIWASVTPAFGIEVARILINQEKIQVLDRINKKSHEYSFQELSNQIGVRLNYRLVQSIMLGNLVIPYENQKVIKDSIYYHYEALEGKFKVQNYVGILSSKLEKLIVSQNEPKNKIEVDYNDFRDVDSGKTFPHAIFALISYDDKSRPVNFAKINYQKIQIEKKSLRFPFSIPNRYEKRKSKSR